MPTCTNLHAAVDTLVQAHRDELHRLVQAAESKLARDMHWETTANRQRDEIARLTLESEGRRKALEQVGEERREQWIRAERAEAEVARLRQDLADATEAIRPYAATLTAIRMELGTIEDADLVEEARRLRGALIACVWAFENFGIRPVPAYGDARRALGQSDPLRHIRGPVDEEQASAKRE